jgi:hypothetical protein
MDCEHCAAQLEAVCDSEITRHGILFTLGMFLCVIWMTAKLT